jgi:DNA-directed RNA polymerase specialized sigma24 family protein
MRSSAILTVCKYLHNFNLEKSQNPFAYISTICSRAFLQYIAYSKRHGKIKQYLYDRKPTYYEDTDFYHTQAIDYETIVSYENKDEYDIEEKEKE